MVPKDPLSPRVHVFVQFLPAAYVPDLVLTSWKWWKLWMLISRLGYKKGMASSLSVLFSFLFLFFPLLCPFSFRRPQPTHHPPFLPSSFSFLLLWGKEAALFSAALWRGPHASQEIRGLLTTLEISLEINPPVVVETWDDYKPGQQPDYYLLRDHIHPSQLFLDSWPSETLF